MAHTMARVTAPRKTGMRRTLRGLSVVAIAVLAGLGLTACDDDENSADTASNGGGSQANSPSSPTVDTSGDEADGAQDTDADSSEAEQGSPVECLVGDWLVDNANYVDLYTPNAEMAVDAAGTVVVSFESDGQTTTEYTDWSFTMQQDGQTVTVIRNGIDGGTYSIDSSSSLTMIETFSDSTVQMVVPDMSLEPQPRADGETISSNVEFTCTAETLSMVSEGGASELTRQ